MDAIQLRGIKTHNLKNFNLKLPHHRIYVVTGVSGSGKSSLAFDTLYAEGQRRYVESLSAYARQFLERMEKPDVESVSGIPPALAIEAKNVITNARSTVGTQTEINDYLRLLFARVGRVICPACSTIVTPHHTEDIVRFLLKKHAGQTALLLFTLSLGKQGKKYFKEFLPELERRGFLECFEGGKLLPLEKLMKRKRIGETVSVCVDRLKMDSKNRKRLTDSVDSAARLGHGKMQVVIEGRLYSFSDEYRCLTCGKLFWEPSPNLFSFNSPLGACPTCQGFGRVITIDPNLVIPDVKKSLAEGAIEPWTKPSASWEFKQLLDFCHKRKIPLHTPWCQLSEKQRRIIWEGSEGSDYFSVTEFFKHLESKTYKMHIRIFLSKYRGFEPCRMCGEGRLKPEALAVRIQGKNIHELQSLSIRDLKLFLGNLKFDPDEFSRVEPVFLEIKNRVRFLNEVGLGYLSLARMSRTLSGGEVQRINLATSLGSALVDTLYVLDEPSIGLHERDNDLLIRLIKELRDLRNTVVVVEHDRTMIEAADEVIDLGPQGGEGGGRLVFQGNVETLKKEKDSLTGQYLSGTRAVKRRNRRHTIADGSVRITGACQHNLKDINLQIPLRQLVVLTGVSGSGKSTLLYEVLYNHFLRFKGEPVQDLGAVKKIEGFDRIDACVLVDQTPIGRTSRSNPVTYVKAFDDIRKLFAGTRDAKRQGFHAGWFSFNVDGGRCDACKGEGQQKIEMHFLADVYVTCEACQGKRFRPEILDIRYEGKNVDDVLAMTVEEALLFFKNIKPLAEKLTLLNRVGLGYLRLGQSATTLSGGEAQRLKLAHEMMERRAQHILYLFDEPTTGLHYHDIHYLIEAFDELLNRGHSILVIEHNMEVIRSADSIIDLGPEGGDEGGNLVYAGSLQGILEVPNSHTGRYLQKHLQSARGGE